MLDIKLIVENADYVKDAMSHRSGKYDVDKVLSLYAKRREILMEVETKKATRNKVSDEIAVIKRNKGDASAMIAEMKELGEEIKELDAALAEIEPALKEAVLSIPNVPDKSVPIGKDDNDNVEVRRVGFPRTLAQARLLDDVTDIDLVVDLDVDEEKIVDRIVNRMVCSGCGKSFNRHSFDGDKCDECGAELHQRDDDKEEVIRERIKEYKQKTFPIQQYYESKGKLAKIDGNRKVEDVLSDVRKVLSDYRKNG